MPAAGLQDSAPVIGSSFQKVPFTGRTSVSTHIAENNSKEVCLSPVESYDASGTSRVVEILVVLGLKTLLLSPPSIYLTSGLFLSMLALSSHTSPQPSHYCPYAARY